jgi:hypothetical protein
MRWRLPRAELFTFFRYFISKQSLLELFAGTVKLAQNKKRQRAKLSTESEQHV